MKRSILTIIPFAGAAIIAATILLYACSQQELTVSDKAIVPDVNLATGKSDALTDAPLSKSIGAPIDGAKGRKWIANYFKVYGRNDSYTIKAEELQALLDKGAMGIALQYAVDDLKQLHVIPYGVDSNSKLMQAVNVPTEKGSIDWNTSRQWCNNHGGIIRAHFFGADMFVWLLQNQKCAVVKTTVALNETGELQLLLSNAAIVTPDNYGDQSRPCPPYCNGEN